MVCFISWLLYVSVQRHTFAMKLSLAHLTSMLTQTHPVVCILQCVYNTPNTWSLLHFPHIILVVCMWVCVSNSPHQLTSSRTGILSYLIFIPGLWTKMCYIVGTSECLIYEWIIVKYIILLFVPLSNSSFSNVTFQ